MSLSDAKLLEEIEDRLDALEALEALAEHEWTGGVTHSHEEVFGDLLRD